MNYIKRRGAAIIGTVVLTCMSMSHAWADKAEEKALLHDSEYISDEPFKIPQLRWDIIGNHTGYAIGSEKFIQPAKDCLRIKEKDDDYLLQLELCKQERKGWLKI